jgi:hypothetical protein
MDKFQYKRALKNTEQKKFALFIAIPTNALICFLPLLKNNESLIMLSSIIGYIALLIGYLLWIYSKKFQHIPLGALGILPLFSYLILLTELYENIESFYQYIIFSLAFVVVFAALCNISLYIARTKIYKYLKSREKRKISKLEAFFVVPYSASISSMIILGVCISSIINNFLSTNSVIYIAASILMILGSAFIGEVYYRYKQLSEYEEGNFKSNKIHIKSKKKS